MSYACVHVRMSVPVMCVCDPIGMVLIVNTVSATVNTGGCIYCYAIPLGMRCCENNIVVSGDNIYVNLSNYKNINKLSYFNVHLSCYEFTLNSRIFVMTQPDETRREIDIISCIQY